MESLEFVSNLVEALAWPIATVVIVLQFKKALIERLPALLRLTLPGGISAEFTDGVERIVAAADELESVSPPAAAAAEEGEEVVAPIPPVTPSPSDSAEPAPKPEFKFSWKVQPDALSVPDPVTIVANPTGVVMETWKGLEASLRTAVDRLGGNGNNKAVSVSNLLRFLEKRDFFAVADLEIIRELQRLRNLAAHAPDPITPEAAKNFAKFAAQMSNKVILRSMEFVIRDL